MASENKNGSGGVTDAAAFAADFDVGARNPVGWQGSLIAIIALI